MAHIILQILAVLGIILLCLLGLFVLIVLLILFVPIRYKLYGKRAGDDMMASVKVTWLLHLISVFYQYPECKADVIIRVLGIKLWPKKQKAETVQATKPDADADTNTNTDAIANTATGTNTNANSNTDSNINTANAGSDETQASAQEVAQEVTQKTAPESDSEPKQSFFQKIQYTFRSICDKIKRLIENYRYYRDVLTAKENRLLYERCKIKLLKVLKSICPRTIKGDLIIGTGQPDTTGYVLAVYGMLYPIIGSHLNITPDFENTVYEGELLIKGRITIFVLLWNGLRLILDKQLHVLMKQLKREEI